MYVIWKVKEHFNYMNINNICPETSIHILGFLLLRGLLCVCDVECGVVAGVQAQGAVSQVDLLALPRTKRLLCVAPIMVIYGNIEIQFSIVMLRYSISIHNTWGIT